MLKNANILVALFSRDVFKGKQSSKLIVELCNAMENAYTFNETTLGVPDEASPDIPRIILNDENEGLQIEIFPRRINLRCNEGNYETILEKFSKLGDKSLELSIHRIGIVIGSLIEQDNPESFIKTKFIKEGSCEEAKEIGLNFLNKVQRDGLNLNIWSRFNSANRAGAPQKRVCAVEFDVNLADEDTLIFDTETIKSFSRTALVIISELEREYQLTD